MPHDLSPEIQELKSLASAHPGVDGMLQAMLVLLENAADSAVVISALDGIDAQAYGNEVLREKAADLLTDAGNPSLAAAWRPAPPAPTAPTNVIAFAQGDSEAPPPAPARPGDPISFEDIGGLEAVKSQVRRKIINPFLNQGLFQKFRRKAGGGVLMYGPPGCGKTMLARALANECSARFVEVRAADILDLYCGNAEKRIAAVFEDARRQPPVVLFFDEVEALAQRRQFDASTRVNTVVSALLNEMDGFRGNSDGILFLGATNVPWALDSAFRRPGRFDRTIFVPPPDRIARKFILKRVLEDRPVVNDLDLRPIIERTPGFSGADIAALVETAADFAIEESDRADALVPIDNSHFKDALGELRPSTGEWLGQARNFGEYANQDGLYDDLRDFLRKHAS